MYLTPIEYFGIVASVALGAMITRFAPFILFASKGKPSNTIIWLGKVLPPAMMGLLVVYCFKSVDFLSDLHGIPEIIATLVTAGIHLWKGNIFLSIGVGTVLYMILVQFVFV